MSEGGGGEIMYSHGIRRKTHTRVCVYIYIYREREREKEPSKL